MRINEEWRKNRRAKNGRLMNERMKNERIRNITYPVLRYELVETPSTSHHKIGNPQQVQNTILLTLI
jgi:hypothetical protein